MKKNILILFICVLGFNCSSDSEVVSNVNTTPTVTKTPKYNNGIFFTHTGVSNINSKISFVSTKRKTIQEVYTSTTNHIVAIDGDKSYYYLSGQKFDNKGSAAIYIKDVETFKDVTTITNNISHPVRVISYKGKILVVNSNNGITTDGKPYISIFSIKSQFPFENKVNLPEKSKVKAVKVLDNKIYITLAPSTLLQSKESVLIFNIDTQSIESTITLNQHNRYTISDLSFFKNEVYIIINPGVSLFANTEREIYKLSRNSFDLTYKIAEKHFSGLSKITTRNDNLYAYVASGNILYKHKTGTIALERAFVNNENIQFVRFLSDTELLILSSLGKLHIKDLTNTSVNKQLIDFTFNIHLGSVTIFNI